MGKDKLLAGAALFAAVGLVVWGASRDRDASLETPPPCEVAAALESVWTEARRDAISEALSAVQQPYARTSARTVASELNAYAATIGQASLDFCSGAHAERSSARATEACIRRRVIGLDALAKRLEKGEAVQRAVDIVLALPPLATCAFVGHDVTLTDEETLAYEEAALAVAVGRNDEALALLPDAAAIDAPSATARRQLIRASVLVDSVEASQALDAAMWAAIGSGNDALVVEVALASAHIEGEAGNYDRAHERWRYAASTAQRMGLPVDVERRLLMVEGRLREQRGDGAAAFEIYERVTALTDATRGAKNAALVDPLVAAARTLVRQGEVERARPLFSRALAIAGETYGGSHPRVASAVREQGRAMVDVDSPQAAKILAEAIEVRQATLGQQSPQLRAWWIDLGRAEAAHGNWAASSRAYEQAILIHTGAKLPSDTLLSVALQGLGLAHGRGGDWALALESFKRAVEVNEAGKIEGVTASATHANMALAYAGLDRPAEAFLASTQALVSLPEGDPGYGSAIAKLAGYALDAGELESALGLGTKAVERLDPNDSAADRIVALSTVGTAALALERDAIAVGAFGSALEIASKEGAAPETLSSVALGFATAAWRSGDRDEAKRVVAEVRDKLTQRGEPAAAAAAPLTAWLQRRDASL